MAVAVLGVLAGLDRGVSAGDAAAPILASAPAAPPTPPVPATTPSSVFPAKELLALIRERSVHRRDIDWAKAEPEYLERIARATTDEERAGAVTRLFAEMNDVHSMLHVGGRTFAHYEGVDEEVRGKLLPLLDRQRAQSGKVVASVLEGGWGYVMVPSMAASSQPEIDRLARELRQRIAEVATRKPAGWIVDLRLNGGGNMVPMLVGLAPLLGEGVVGGTVDADGRVVHEWVLKPDGLYWREGTGDRRFASLDLPVTLPEPTPPITVLVGPVTASSGQAAALAFEGRPRCILIGEPTAKGYTTAINPFVIDANTTLSLAVGYMANRGGAPCRSHVVPQRLVEGGDAFDVLVTDAKVTAAIAWLQGEGAARRE